MKILMAQRSPCIRNLKQAICLRERGHEVWLACEQYPSMYGIDPEEVYDGLIRVQGIAEILSIAEWFDIVHCHNEPDQFGSMMTVSPVPSIHDCHDLMSARGLGYNVLEEGVATKYSDARMYVSNYQKDIAVERYSVPKDLPTLVFNSGVLAEHVPQTTLPKIGKGAELHLVYEGGLNTVEHTHRYLIPEFKKLCEGGAWVHVYGFWHSESRAQYMKQIDHPRFVIHEALPTPQLMVEMTQYDMGLCIFNINAGNEHHIEGTLPNKLYEYLCCGLPVLASNLVEMREFIKRNRCGMIWNDDAAEVLELWKTCVEMYDVGRNSGLVPVSRFTVQDTIGDVEKLYEDIKDGARKEMKLNFPGIDWIWDPKKWAMRFDPPEGSKMVRRGLIGSLPSDATLALEAIIANGAFEEL